MRPPIRSPRKSAASTVMNSGALQIVIREPTATEVFATPQK